MPSKKGCALISCVGVSALKGRSVLALLTQVEEACVQGTLRMGLGESSMNKAR
jgi:hypothetical protein